MAEPIVKIAAQCSPDQVTLVPENRAELTTEGGLDCVKFSAALKAVVHRMHKKVSCVSAFITPDHDQITASADAGCDAIELHTGAYANAKSRCRAARRIKGIDVGRDTAWPRKLIVHAGHGLTYRNIGPVAAIEGLCEFNIGHSIVARSSFVGIREATRK